ncbi:coiled-coil domain-containing protein 28A-like [Gigantopelta aegis]|uniref:coiled-coil domain-containing protein 28A-like n=1 Tax=Gigantopelta aegis TaxID=1735272 RepID=UPI001B88C276|nr:coiled-coil domain-containing protein 28A-like [Gigantopelta aegis]XP_041351339.1 coiled-coil domain-containing protein 28A-like [Gigantopelta aegis]
MANPEGFQTKERPRSLNKQRMPHPQHVVEKTAKGKSTTIGDDANRPCKEHSFLTDVADVRSMEQGLLGLLEDFHSGKLRAFGEEANFDKMDQIREQQERLARLHFELDIQQDMHRINSDAARTVANENLVKLINQLNGLGASIQALQTDGTKKEDKSHR